MEERDAVITDTAAEVTEMAIQIREVHVCLLGLPNTDDRGICGMVLTQKKDLDAFKRDVAAVGVAFTVALIGVIAVMI